MRPERMSGLADNLYGFDMTLLVLNLILAYANRDGVGSSSGDTLRFLAPQLLVFTTTFLVLANWWRLHQRFLDGTTALDPSLSSLHMLSLIFVALMAFTSSIWASAWNNPLAFSLFALNNLIVLVVIWAARNYSVHRGLSTVVPGTRYVRSSNRNFAWSFVMFAAHVPLAWISMPVAVTSYSFFALLYWLPFGPGRVNNQSDPPRPVAVHETGRGPSAELTGFPAPPNDQ